MIQKLIVMDGAIRLPAGLNVPNGTEVEVVLPDREYNSSFADSIEEFIGCMEGPEDLAENHDHYLYGVDRG